MGSGGTDSRRSPLPGAFKKIAPIDRRTTRWNDDRHDRHELSDTFAKVTLSKEQVSTWKRRERIISRTQKLVRLNPTGIISPVQPGVHTQVHLFTESTHDETALRIYHRP